LIICLKETNIKDPGCFVQLTELHGLKGLICCLLSGGMIFACIVEKESTANRKLWLLLGRIGINKISALRKPAGFS